MTDFEAEGLKAPRTAETVCVDEWDERAHKRLFAYVWNTGLQAARVYGEGEYPYIEAVRSRRVTCHPKRVARMRYLLKARDVWLLDMRTTQRSDITQGYADELWLDLMRAAEQQAARDVLGDATLALRYQPKQGKAG